MQNSEKNLNYPNIQSNIHTPQRQKEEKYHPFAIVRGKNKLSLI